MLHEIIVDILLEVNFFILSTPFLLYTIFLKMKFTLAAAITAFASAVYAQVAFVPNSGVAVNLPFLGVSYPPPAERLITKLTLFFHLIGSYQCW